MRTLGEGSDQRLCTRLLRRRRFHILKTFGAFRRPSVIGVDQSVSPVTSSLRAAACTWPWQAILLPIEMADLGRVL